MSKHSTNRSCHEMSRSRSAFTLIELLVVIAIIALLISILLPSLDAARRQAKQNACLSHIKNIATSSRVYEADDPSGWGIPVHPLQFFQCPGAADATGVDGGCADPIFIGAYEWGGKSGVGQTDNVLFPGSNDPLNSKYGTKAGMGPATRPMNDLLYPGGFPDFGGLRAGNPLEFRRLDEAGAARDATLELELYMCPSDNGPPRGAHCQDWLDNGERSSYDHFGTSYAANIFMIASGTDNMRTNSPYLRPVSRVVTPARTIYYEENIGRWAWACKRERCDGSLNGLTISGIDPGPTKTLTGWHGKDWEFNRAFVDGHAAFQRVLVEGTENVQGYSFHYSVEHPSGVDPNNNPNACITVRGKGWAKDTLPSPTIRTPLLPKGPPNRPSDEDCITADMRQGP